MNGFFNEKEQIMQDLYPQLVKYLSILFAVSQDLVTPRFNASIPTARVTFSATEEDKNIAFEFNPVFWDSLNRHEKYFVFVHEVLHVVFYHGSRGKKFMEALSEKDRNWKILNKAMDICINELIIREYLDVPFSTLPVLSKMICTIENCFPDRHTSIKTRQSFDYYYYELLQENSQQGGFDTHEFLEASDEVLAAIEDLLSDAIGDLTKEDLEKDALPDKKGYSTQNDVSPDGAISINKTPKQKLESYLDQYLVSSFGGLLSRPKIKRKWYGVNRRTASSFPSDMFLPKTEILTPKIGRTKLVAYCDVSGSVRSISSEMMNIIANIDDKKYDVDIYAWASNVSSKVIIVNGAIRYGGTGRGTVIQRVFKHYEQTYAKDKPDGVIVLTDGDYGNIRQLDDDSFKSWFFFMTCRSDNFPEKARSARISVRG